MQKGSLVGVCFVFLRGKDWCVCVCVCACASQRGKIENERRKASGGDLDRDYESRAARLHVPERTRRNKKLRTPIHRHNLLLGQNTNSNKKKKKPNHKTRSLVNQNANSAVGWFRHVTVNRKNTKKGLRCSIENGSAWNYNRQVTVKPQKKMAQ